MANDKNQQINDAIERAISAAGYVPWEFKDLWDEHDWPPIALTNEAHDLLASVMSAQFLLNSAEIDELLDVQLRSHATAETLPADNFYEFCNPEQSDDQGGVSFDDISPSWWDSDCRNVRLTVDYDCDVNGDHRRYFCGIEIDPKDKSTISALVVCGGAMRRAISAAQHVVAEKQPVDCDLFNEMDAAKDRFFSQIKALS